MDPNEPHWRTNSSFSPPLATDNRFQSDGLLNASHGPPFYGSVSSSYSKETRSRVSSDQQPNHYHSVSDGALPYFGSPSEKFQVSRSTPPLQRFDLGEFSTPAGGAKPEASLFSQSAERCFATGISSVSNSFGSASPHSESGQWGSTSKQPILFPPRNFSGRRSFMSKPVYPLGFHNPVSDFEAHGLADTSSNSRLTPTEINKSPPMWPENASSSELKFHKALSELQKMEASPDAAGISSRREGFRWSNASSYDFGFEGDSIDISEPLESLQSASKFTLDQRCGLCGKLLWHKSPWIVRNSNMPVTGVLPCSHVFHAECLEETTPKSHIHEPPCPLCSKEVKIEGSSLAHSEPLQMALRSARRSHGVNYIASFDAGNGGTVSSDQKDGGLKRNRSMPTFRGGGASLIKNHLKKHFSFKGKSGKDIFGAKVFGRRDPASSSSGFRSNKKQIGCSRIGQSSK